MQGAQINALDVDRVATVELVFTDGERALVAVGPAGVVDHHIQTSVVCHRLIDQALHVGAAGDVGLYVADPTARSADLVGDPLATFGVDVVDDDGGAFFGQSLCNAFPDAASGAGDDDGFTLETHALVL